MFGGDAIARLAGRYFPRGKEKAPQASVDPIVQWLNASADDVKVEFVKLTVDVQQELAGREIIGAIGRYVIQNTHGAPEIPRQDLREHFNELCDILKFYDIAPYEMNHMINYSFNLMQSTSGEQSNE